MADDDWKQMKVDWSDAEMVVAIRYPSTFIGGTPTQNVVLAQVKTFDGRTSTPHDVIDGLNNGNMGRVIKHPRYTFDLTVFPHGKGFDLINKIQGGRRYFDLVMAPAEYFDATDQDASVGQPIGAVWTVGRAVFEGAFVNDKSEKFVINGEPATTFSCGALRYAWDQDQDGTNDVQLGNGFAGQSLTDSELGLDSLREVGGPVDA